MIQFWDHEYAVIVRERADFLFIFFISKNDPILDPPISSFSARTCGFSVHFWRSPISCSKHQGTTACPTFDYQSKKYAFERDRHRQTDGRTKIFEALYNSPFGAKKKLKIIFDYSVVRRRISTQSGSPCFAA